MHYSHNDDFVVNACFTNRKRSIDGSLSLCQCAYSSSCTVPPSTTLSFPSRQPDRSHPLTRSLPPSSSILHRTSSHPPRRTDVPPQLSDLHHPLPRRPVPCCYASGPTSPLSNLLQGVFSADSSGRSGRRGERWVVLQRYSDCFGVADGPRWGNGQRTRRVGEGERGSRLRGGRREAWQVAGLWCCLGSLCGWGGCV